LKQLIFTKLKSKKGEFAIDVFLSICVYILTFLTLMLGLIYVLQVYNACYICRRVVRDVEIRGEYNYQIEETLVEQLGGSGLNGLSIAISDDVSYYETTEFGGKIQLQTPFTIILTAHYDVHIATFGDEPLEMELPINIQLTGYSERYWKPST